MRNERLLPRTELGEIMTPAYVIDESALHRNLRILNDVRQRSGCKILLALKAFSMFAVSPWISEYLAGTTASGLYEARLGREEFCRHAESEVHVFSPAYLDSEFGDIAELSDHIVFNSFAQLRKFRSRSKGKSLGIRINPECSTQDEPIYDPCAPFSRLGVTLANFDEAEFEGVDGLHFHTLCEQGFEPLAKTVEAVEQKFGKYLHKCKWVNFGGGHHITKPGYDIEGLVSLIKRFSEKYGVQVYLEPGEAVVLNAGWLVTRVLEIVHNGMDIAILDTSAACHMPDVLEMPYRPPLYNSGQPGEKKYTYRLSSRTCLAGDIIGDYSFDEPLREGDVLCFEDMALYTMVKNNTFNGMPLPEIGILRSSYELVKRFGYEDFKGRLS